MFPDHDKWRIGSVRTTQTPAQDDQNVQSGSFKAPWFGISGGQATTTALPRGMELHEVGGQNDVLRGAERFDSDLELKPTTYLLSCARGQALSIDAIGHPSFGFSGGA